jgi:hypothetical protein
MDNNEAIKPTFYQDFSTKIEEVSGEKEFTEDQQALAYITHFKGWELLKAYKVRLEEYLDSMVSEAMASGMSMQELGERTMVKELAKLVMNSLIR